MTYNKHMAKRDDDLEFSINAPFDDGRAVIDKVPLYLVNGSLGAGKTSVLEFLLQQSGYKGSRVIENEYANENVDGYRLEKLADIVTTLAGDCVCCSSKHALTRMLLDFCRNSPAPVFIEATGVARTMNLVEKLINAQIFNKYELAQSFYVIDAHEILHGIEPAHEIELQAADMILVTKEDLLSDDERLQYESKLSSLPHGKILSAPRGKFDINKMTTPSGLLAFFDTYDGELVVPDNPTYAVLDVSGMKIAAATLEKIWPELFDAYKLRRMKGCFIDDNGARHHLEATENQIQIANSAAQEPAKIVLIGERADEITREVLSAQLMMFE